MDTFGNRLMRLLESKNMTQMDLAKGTGLTTATISRYINNKRDPHGDQNICPVFVPYYPIKKKAPVQEAFLLY